MSNCGKPTQIERLADEQRAVALDGRPGRLRDQVNGAVKAHAQHEGDQGGESQVAAERSGAVSPPGFSADELDEDQKAWARRLTARMAQLRMNPLPSQSLRWPSSSMAMSAPRPMAIRAGCPSQSPSFSSFVGAQLLGRDRRKDRGEHDDARNEVDVEVPGANPRVSVNRPPMYGPTAGASVAVMPEHGLTDALQMSWACK